MKGNKGKRSDFIACNHKRMNDMKKIYPKEWLELHPYKRTDSVDRYYVDIANEIYDVLSFSAVTDGLGSDESIRYASLCLAAWFEDIISQTGI